MLKDAMRKIGRGPHYRVFQTRPFPTGIWWFTKRRLWGVVLTRLERGRMDRRLFNRPAVSARRRVELHR